MIPTKTHGYLDYTMALLLIGSPWLFGFDAGGVETWMPVLLGAGTIVYSLITDYELGVSQVISMKTHLMIDFMSGILLAFSPWIFGFADYVIAPHIILGITGVLASLLTKKDPVHGPRAHHHHSTAQ